MFKKLLKYLTYFSLVMGIVFSASVCSNQTYTLPSGEVLSDPTRPYGSKAKLSSSGKKRQEKLSLNYIMGSGNNKRAMINGKKVYIGSYVAGAKVRSISSDFVALERNGKEIVLHLKKLRSIKQ